MVRTVILLHLLIGTVIMFFLEVFWDKLELEDEEEGLTLDMRLRIGVVVLWPILVLAAILGVLRNNGDNNDATGPGYGT